ncbi:MAG: DUF4331 domain-containing protein [Alphaproteobacteria bacterium]|nr:DUF4331 domain-containing protein [Alphaproteobacteria bacterium]
MKYRKIVSTVAVGAILAGMLPVAPVLASSHMDAPLITFDDPANTTDVYAFRSESEDGSTQYLTTALAVYPFEEPGIGPNNYRFDDRVLYEIHVSLDGDVGTGAKTISYQFEFDTTFQNEQTILQAYEGVVNETFGATQNLRQTYKVTRVDGAGSTVLFDHADTMVPPNNQGLVTPFYNRDDDGDRTAKPGVDDANDLDVYTAAAIAQNAGSYQVFAGQRDDGFYADIQSIFDLDFSFGGATGTPTKPFDSQGGFNVHTIVLNIPLSELGGAGFAGVHATTSRQQMVNGAMEWVQVSRQGNPLFAEALVKIIDKDLYNASDATEDEALFAIYAEAPQLAAVLGSTPLPSLLDPTVLLVRDIYIPDVIKVDLSTGPARLAGEDGFNRLSVFGGDLLPTTNLGSALDFGGVVPGGWPNGRRFGDDVDDIAINALGVATTDLDGVTENDITFNDVFPYAATPHNGRNHGHHGEEAGNGPDAGNGNGKGKGKNK